MKVSGAVFAVAVPARAQRVQSALDLGVNRAVDRVRLGLVGDHIPDQREDPPPRNGQAEPLHQPLRPEQHL